MTQDRHSNNTLAYDAFRASRMQLRDAENRLVSAATPNGSFTYTYDGDGKRVMKSGGTIYWYGMNSDPLMETDLNNNMRFAYFFFDGKRVARQDSSNGISWFFSDHLGSSRLVWTLSGNNDSDFYPFGGERVFSTGTPTHYKFTGKERDPETGLDNFGARYFGSNLGRFMTPDWAARPTTVPYAVFGDPQSLNLYAYVRDDPVTDADADGHQAPNVIECQNHDSIACPNAQQAQVQQQQAQQQSSTQQLTNAQDAARNNPNLQPTKGGKTFCNVATCQIAKAMGAPMGPLTNPKNGQPALANQIAANLGKSGSGYRQVTPQEAQELANQGKLVIGVQPHAGHGHIVTVRPGGSGSDPLVNNMGKHVDIRPASRAFYSSPAVKYYTPQ